MDIIVSNNKDIKNIHSDFIQGVIAAMIRADKKAKANQKEQSTKKSSEVKV